MKLMLLYGLITAMFLCFESCGDAGLPASCVCEAHNPADGYGDIRGVPVETGFGEETEYAGNEPAPAGDLTKPDIQGEQASCKAGGASVNTNGGIYRPFFNRHGEDVTLFGIRSPKLLFFLLISGIGFLARTMERRNEQI
ncbi:MAG: hypothetical protein LBR26_10525 [Prevotella sp.]|jgi:hypothetical protein|nr:hypothetical protein [Prevotella sp.]